MYPALALFMLKLDKIAMSFGLAKSVNIAGYPSSARVRFHLDFVCGSIACGVPAIKSISASRVGKQQCNDTCRP